MCVFGILTCTVENRKPTQIVQIVEQQQAMFVHTCDMLSSLLTCQTWHTVWTLASKHISTHCLPP